MKVINLVSWAGLDFSYLPGQEIEVDDHVGLARIAAGLAAPVDPVAHPADQPEDVPSSPQVEAVNGRRPTKRSKSNAS